jgi:adenylate cyclase
MPKDAAEILVDLDAIRDATLELGELCRGCSDYLASCLGFDEAHVLLRNEEAGGLDNPVPDRPLSDDIRAYVRAMERTAGHKPPADTHVLGLTLQPRDKNLGLLVVRRFAPLDSTDQRLAQIAATSIDSAVEHALTYALLEQRNRELEAVFALDRLRDEHLPFDSMLDRAIGEILEFIPADAAAVVLFCEATGVVDIRLPASACQTELDRPECLTAMKQLAFQAFSLRSLVTAERLHPAIGAALCAPLILDSDIIGAFQVFQRNPRPFGEPQRRLLTAMASQIDTAIFEDQQRQRIKGVFTRYVAEDVVDQMLKTDCDFFGGQRLELSVLFSDLRGFTAASERLDTDTVVRMLNQHLSAMAEVVLRNRGTLDKFIGDCVMAFWGAPVHQPDHAYRAVKTAVQMRSAHQRLLTAWAADGLPSIQVGIGINTGDMFVGNIGDERKSSYTVIGDNVNLASRLEGIARGGEVLITQATRELLGDRAVVEEQEPVRVKGKSEPIALFNVLQVH